MKNSNNKYYTIKQDGIGKRIQTLEPKIITISRTTLFHTIQISRCYENSGYIYILPEEYDRIYSDILNMERVI